MGQQVEATPLTPCAKNSTGATIPNAAMCRKGDKVAPDDGVHESNEQVARSLLDNRNQSDDDLMNGLYKLGLKKMYVDPESEKRVSITLRPAQLRALRFALFRGCTPNHQDEEVGGVLLDVEMGLGKTLVALCAIMVHKTITTGPAIVIAPGTLARQWAAEARRFFGDAFRLILAEKYDVWYYFDATQSARRASCSRHTLQECDIFLISSDAMRACWRRDMGMLEYTDGTAVVTHQRGSGTRMIVERLEATACRKVRPLTPGERELARKLEWRMMRTETLKSKPVPLWSPAAASILHPILATCWKLQVIDESHRIRNSLTELFKSCRFLRVERLVMLLTGTPIVNTSTDLWAQLICCRCNHVPPFQDYKHMCASVVSNRCTQLQSDEAEQELDNLLRPHMLVIKREDTAVIDREQEEAMPRIMPMPSGSDDNDTITREWSVSPCVVTNTTQTRMTGHWRLFSPAVRDIPAAYCQNLVLEASIELDGALNAAAEMVRESLVQQENARGTTMHVFAALTIMRYLSESWRYPSPAVDKFLRGLTNIQWTPDLAHPKADAVLYYVQRFLPADEKVVVFCHFEGSVRDVADRLTANKIGCATLTGETPVGDRTQILARFQNQARLRVLVCTHIAELGLNMQRANHCIFLSSWWHSKGDQQALSRLLRMGQEREVYITWLTTTGRGLYKTVEEVMIERSLGKQKLGSEFEALASAFDATQQPECLPPKNAYCAERPGRRLPAWILDDGRPAPTTHRKIAAPTPPCSSASTSSSSPSDSGARHRLGTRSGSPITLAEDETAAPRKRSKRIVDEPDVMAASPRQARRVTDERNPAVRSTRLVQRSSVWQGMSRQDLVEAIGDVRGSGMSGLVCMPPSSAEMSLKELKKLFM